MQRVKSLDDPIVFLHILSEKRTGNVSEKDNVAKKVGHKLKKYVKLRNSRFMMSWCFNMHNTLAK